MRNVTPLQTILDNCSQNHRIARSTLDEVFSGIDMHFPVIFGKTLPLLAHKMGMAGITLQRRVYLLDKVRQYPVEKFLVLLRHEAQHVHQQQTNSLFYLHYGYHWLQAFFRNVFLARNDRQFPKRGISYNAYRGIREEVEAYATGDMTHALLERRK